MNFINAKPAFAQEAAEKQKGLNIFLEMLMGVAGFFVVQILSAIVIAVFAVIAVFGSMIVNGGQFNGVSEDIINVVSLFACLLHTTVILLFCYLVQKRRPYTLGFTKKGVAAQYIIGLVIGFAMFGAAVLIGVVTGALEFGGYVFNGAVGLFIMFFIGFIIQGMSEEVLCRGFLMISISRRYSMLLAVVVNSVLFAAMHLFNSGISVLAIVNLTLFGIFASVYMLYTENIWGVSAIHSIWNFVQGNFFGIKVSGMQLNCTIFSFESNGKTLINGGDFGLEGGIAVSIVLVLATVITLILMYMKSKKAASAN